MTDSSIALIIDIVGSRALADRAAAQAELERVFADLHARRPFVEAPHPTIGDEFQAVSPDLAHALWASDLVLLLPEGLSCRVGLGAGEFRTVASAGRDIPEGSAWWNARSAIERAHRLQDAQSTPFSRSWYVGDADAGVNSFLLLRDDVIARMSPAERRLTAARLLGRTQAEAAKEAGVTQSAVSQRLAASGGRAIQLADLEVAR